MCPGMRLINHPVGQTTAKRRQECCVCASACEAAFVSASARSEKRQGELQEMDSAFFFFKASAHESDLTANRCHSGNTLFIKLY